MLPKGTYQLVKNHYIYKQMFCPYYKKNQGQCEQLLIEIALKCPIIYSCNFTRNLALFTLDED